MAKRKPAKVTPPEPTEAQKRFEEIRDELVSMDENIILFDGYEEALVGYADHFGGDGYKTVAAYDWDKCIEILMTRDGMSHEEAEEFFSVNTLGCYAGALNPVFVKLLTKTSQDSKKS